MKDKSAFQQKIKLLTKLFDFGCNTEKKLQQLDMESILKIPGITIPDMALIIEFQKETKANKLFSYLGGGADEQQTSDMGFQAVCIGYMLCKKYGIDTQNFAINRIPEKLAAKESKDIRFELSKMRNAMADIHSRVSDELYRKKQARSKEQER